MLFGIFRYDSCDDFRVHAVVLPKLIVRQYFTPDVILENLTLVRPRHEAFPLRIELFWREPHGTTCVQVCPFCDAVYYVHKELKALCSISVMAAEMNEQILELIKKRMDMGRKHYGHGLLEDSGYDWVKEALEEALDLSIYVAARLVEVSRHNADRPSHGS